MDLLQTHVGTSLNSDALHRTLNAMKSELGLVRAFPVNDALHQCLGVVRNELEFPHFVGWYK
jgi:hypothetical protein